MDSGLRGQVGGVGFGGEVVSSDLGGEFDGNGLWGEVVGGGLGGELLRYPNHIHRSSSCVFLSLTSNMF